VVATRKAFFPSRCRTSRLEEKVYKPSKTLYKNRGSSLGIVWINNDQDDKDEKETVPPVTPDNSDDVIQKIRDLEDFTRLWLSIGGLHEAITAGTIKIGLRWKDTTGSPSVRLFQAADSRGAVDYLTDIESANIQLSDSYNTAIGTLSGTETLVFPNSFWVGISRTNTFKYLLFEGVAEGKGKIEMVFLKGTEEIGFGCSLYLDLKNVRKMYHRGRVDWPESLRAPYDYTFGTYPINPTIEFTTDVDENPFEPAYDEAKQSFIWVYGWIPQGEDGYTEAKHIIGDTMFKRMWHSGFKGRFCSFRWPTIKIGFTGYNESEYRAYKCGRALRDYVNSLPHDYLNYLAAHSLGNACASEALKQGLEVENYIIMQGAVPASMYDTDTLLDANWDFVTADTASELGYRGYFTGIEDSVNGSIINYFNPLDVANEGWEFNNRHFRPQKYLLGPWYDYDPSAAIGRRLSLTFKISLGRYITDPHEAMGFVVNSQSWNIGYENRTAGAVDSLRSVNLNAAYGFGSAHGAQFDRSIQVLREFYNQLLFDINLIPNL
jgi:hypothetical protein